MQTFGKQSIRSEPFYLMKYLRCLLWTFVECALICFQYIKYDVWHSLAIFWEVLWRFVLPSTREVEQDIALGLQFKSLSPLLSPFCFYFFLFFLPCAVLFSCAAASLFPALLRQRVGGAESLRRVLHERFLCHVTRGAPDQTLNALHQPHQRPLALGKRLVLSFAESHHCPFVSISGPLLVMC